MNKLMAASTLLLASMAFAASAQTNAPASTAVSSDTGTPTQATPPANKKAQRSAKQEMVKGTTEAATMPSPQKVQPTPAKKKTKPTSAERKELMQGVNKSASSQYGPSAAEASAKIDPNLPKAAKPDFSDPTTQKAMQNQKP